MASPARFSTFAGLGILLIGAARVADAALVVGEDDVAERRVEVDEQVVAVAVARLGAVDDRDRGVPVQTWPGSVTFPARRTPPPPRKRRLAPDRDQPPGARAPARCERQDAALTAIVPRIGRRTRYAGPKRKRPGAGRCQLPQVAGARVRVEQSAVGRDGEADAPCRRQAVGAVEREQRARLVRRSGGAAATSAATTVTARSLMRARRAAAAPARPSGSPPSRSPCRRAGSGRGRCRSTTAGSRSISSSMARCARLLVAARLDHRPDGAGAHVVAEEDAQLERVAVDGRRGLLEPLAQRRPAGGA